MPRPTRSDAPLLLALAFGFAVAHTQSPPFFSNQNQYLLHGLAFAGYGHLSGDWLANTKDPTPAFSGLVAALFRLGGLVAIQAAYFLMLVAYFLAAWRLVAALPGVNRTRTTLLGFAALFTLTHAAIPRWLSVQLLGVDYPWFLQAGVAGQYALGPGLQPSAFGMLLVAGVAAFAGGRPYLAAVLGALAAVLHPTYLLPAGLLTAGYVVALLREKRTRTALGVGAAALAIVAPVVAYTLAVFPPSSAESFAEAQHVLAEVRIPHHARVHRWLDVVAGLQIAWIVLGLVLLRNTRLFVPLLIAAGGAIALTLVQVATENDTLALMFPWRISVVLVPVTTASVAGKLVGSMRDRPAARWGFAAIFGALTVSGVAVVGGNLGYAMNEGERPVLDYVRTHAAAGDVYLIPVRVPPVGTGPRGSVSTSFTPPPRPKPGSNLIPVDLQRFRLATGTPVYVDFKSVPYADVEVLEWYRRVKRAEAWYALPDWDAAGLRAQLAAEGITHVLVPRQQVVKASFLDVLYADEAYVVYRVQ